MSEQNAGTNPPTNPPTNAPANNPADPPDWYKSPPAWLQQPQQPQQNAGVGQQVVSRGDLMSAIQGMPETIINGIREAFPQPQQTPPPDNSGQQQQQQQSNTPPPAGDEQTPGKSGSFAEWWFGK